MAYLVDILTTLNNDVVTMKYNNIKLKYETADYLAVSKLPLYLTSISTDKGDLIKILYVLLIWLKKNQISVSLISESVFDLFKNSIANEWSSCSLFEAFRKDYLINTKDFKHVLYLICDYDFIHSVYLRNNSHICNFKYPESYFSLLLINRYLRTNILSVSIDDIRIYGLSSLTPRYCKNIKKEEDLLLFYSIILKYISLDWLCTYGIDSFIFHLRRILYYTITLKKDLVSTEISIEDSEFRYLLFFLLDIDIEG